MKLEKNILLNVSGTTLISYGIGLVYLLLFFLLRSGRQYGYWTEMGSMRNDMPVGEFDLSSILWDLNVMEFDYYVIIGVIFFIALLIFSQGIDLIKKKFSVFSLVLSIVVFGIFSLVLYTRLHSF